MLLKKEIQVCLICGLILFGFAACMQSDMEFSKPNIVFIMSDDQGYGDLGCYGSEQIATPRLDQMASEGMRFTQVYAGSPVCAPSRCTLMTGKHSGHGRRRDNRSTFDKEKPFGKRRLISLEDNDFTIGEMLKESAYVTGGFGKWGLGNPGTPGTPDKQGFDQFFGYLDQIHAHDHYTNFMMNHLDTIPIPANDNQAKGQYIPDLITEKALSFIRNNQDTSFFLYLPITPPHGQYVVPDQGMYANEDWPERVKNYAAMITRMDRQIGEIFDLLSELELDENTIVFFTSDNGPNPPFLKILESNKPFRGVKRQLWEGGIRVPMIVRWPNKVPSGVTNDYVWTFYDVMPTLADFVGHEPLNNLDGISVLPTILGKNQEQKPFHYWEFYSPFQQAVRIGDWKGYRTGTSEPIQLFDLTKDHKEINDISSQNPDIVKKIEEIMSSEHSPSEYWPSIDFANK